MLSKGISTENRVERIESIASSIVERKEKEIAEICDIMKGLHDEYSDGVFGSYYYHLDIITQFINDHSEEELNSISVNARGANFFDAAALYLRTEDFITVLNTPSRGQTKANLTERINRKDKFGNNLYKYAASNQLFNPMKGVHSKRLIAYLDRALFRECGFHIKQRPDDLRPIKYIDNNIYLGQEDCEVDIHFKKFRSDLDALVEELYSRQMKEVSTEEIVHQLLKLAIKHNKVNIVKAMVTDEYWRKPYYKGNTLLHYFAKSDFLTGSIPIRKTILRQINPEILRPNDKGKTPLSIARKAGLHAQKTQQSLLIHLKPTIETLKRQIRAGKVDDVIAFIKKNNKDDIDQLVFDENGASLFQYAAAHLEIEKFNRILSTPSFKDGYTLVASDRKRAERVLKRDKLGRSLIDYAMMKKNQTIQDFKMHLHFRERAFRVFTQVGDNSLKYASILFRLNTVPRDQFIYKAKALIVAGADISVHSEKSHKTLAQLLIEADAAFEEIVMKALDNEKYKDEPIYQFRKARNINEMITILNKMESAEIPFFVRLLINHRPNLAFQLADRADQCHALSHHAQVLKELAKCAEKKSPQRALYCYLNALDVAERQNDKKQQDGIKRDIYRIKQDLKAQNAEALVNMANRKIASSLKKQLASMSTFNIVGRVRLFRQLSQLAKEDPAILETIADCYQMNIVPLERNQREKAIAIYRRLYREQWSCSAEWKLIQIRLETEKAQYQELVHEALLSSMQLLRDHEHRHEAMAYIKRCETNRLLSPNLKWFAKMIDGKFNNDSELLRHAYSELQKISPNDAELMYGQIVNLMGKPEDKLEVASKAPIVPSAPPKEEVGFSHAYLTLPTREPVEVEKIELEEMEDKKEKVAAPIIHRQPVQQQSKQSSNSGILHSYQMWMSTKKQEVVAAKDEIEMKAPEAVVEDAGAKDRMQILERAPSVWHLPALPSLPFFGRKKKEEVPAQPSRKRVQQLA